uniref:Uncharacterized protein n=1 Tax=Arundo donax TaxID=35708 RepID=A0A0A9DJ18_ARUDO
MKYNFVLVIVNFDLQGQVCQKIICMFHLLVSLSEYQFSEVNTTFTNAVSQWVHSS